MGKIIFTIPSPQTFINAPCSRFFLFLMLALLHAAMDQPNARAATEAQCLANSLPELTQCLNQHNDANNLTIVVEQDLTCSGAACCLAGMASTIPLNHRQVAVQGNGHTLHRYSPSGLKGFCPAVVLNSRSSNISIDNLKFNEHATACDAPDVAAGDPSCGSGVIELLGSSSTSLNKVILENTRGVALKVFSVNGLSFTNSTINFAGTLGIQIGLITQNSDGTPGINRPAQNVSILNNSFTNTHTNAVAVVGLVGGKISGNVFRNNHWHGVYGVTTGQGSTVTSGGGQLYIGLAKSLEVSGNTISDGSCANCFTNEVTGIELGYWVSLSGFASPSWDNILDDVSIHDNVVAFNSNGIHMNLLMKPWQQSPPQYILPNYGSLKIFNNLLLGNKLSFAASGLLPDNKFGVNTEIAAQKTVLFDTKPSFNEWSAGNGSQGFSGVNCDPVNLQPPGGSCVKRFDLRAVTDSAGIFDRGIYTPVGTSTHASVSLGYRNGAWGGGEACLVFLGAGNVLSTGQSCAYIPPSVDWGFFSQSIENVLIPPGTATVSVQFGLGAAKQLLDINRISLILH